MDPFLIALGIRLKQIRVKKKFTQDHAEPEISRPTLSKWERGVTPPNISYLKRICEIYDVRLSQVIKETEEIQLEREKEK